MKPLFHIIVLFQQEVEVKLLENVKEQSVIKKVLNQELEEGIIKL
jgi:hypothetical protein